MDGTSLNDKWKDSFDKIMDRQPLLRELNIIKRTVRASFNIDSSLENSNANILTNIFEPFKLKSELTINSGNRCESVSTPCTKGNSTMLFHCTLSPITGSKLDVFIPNANVGAHNLISATKKLDMKNCYFDPLIGEHDCITIKSSDGQQKQKRSSLLILRPGKWRKSLLTWRRTQTNEALADLNMSVKNTKVRGRKSSSNASNISTKDYEKQVLLYCHQRRPICFDTQYAFVNIKSSSKIGEGVYGEVFKFNRTTNPKTEVVLKIIPIEGKAMVNGETQKTFEHILPEIIISQEMCNLRFCERNYTSGFVNIANVSLVRGNYPKHLIELWDNYDEQKGSENDHPKMFPEHQLFVVLELNFAGEDMSTFRFTNAEQAYYALLQIMTTLAVGEVEYQFEHRDLHWGNILIKAANIKKITYKLNGKILTIPSKGIRTTIIDYTLSRITFDKFCYYNDLSSDEELFEATGDYQYDIYRAMREELKNNWTTFSPKTNVLWLSYVNKKMIDCVKYRNVNTKTHKLYIEKLKALKNIMLSFESAAHCVNYVFNY